MNGLTHPAVLLVWFGVTVVIALAVWVRAAMLRSTYAWLPAVLVVLLSLLLFVLLN